MSIFDSGPLSGASVLALLAAAVKYVTWRLEQANKRRLRDAQSIPPSEGQDVPSPAADRALLARLDRAEQHDAIVGALLRTQADLVDTQRQLAVLRNECTKLALRVHALEGDVARKDVQLRAERLSTQVLREQLAHVEAELVTAKGDLEVAHADLRRALLVRD
jgi:hypothetical protein